MATISSNILAKSSATSRLLLRKLDAVVVVAVLVDIDVAVIRSDELVVAVMKTVVKDMIGVCENVLVKVDVKVVVEVLVEDWVPVVSVDTEADVVDVD